MRFLLHVCYDPDKGERPESCRCTHHISKAERDARFHAGELVILDRFNVAQKRRVSTRRLCFPLSARMVSAGDVQRGLEVASERRRIDLIGALSGRGPEVEFWEEVKRRQRAA